MEQFDKMIKEMAEKEETTVPNGFDERVQAALDKLPPKQKKRKLGAVKVAFIAAASCLLLVGTALAASPELRALIWGSLAPYAQDIDPDAEGALAVYDGIEIRLVSALADSRIARMVFEVRDLEGDRLTRLYETQVPGTNGMNGLDWDGYAATKDGDGRWDLLSYDPETGVARFQSRKVMTENVEGFDYQVQIEAGAFDTGSALFYERIQSYNRPDGPFGYLGETEYPDPKEIEYGWTLSAHIKTMSMREIAVDSNVLVLSANGDVVYHVEQVDVSELSVTIGYRAEKAGEDTGAYELWHSAVLELSDGTKLPLIDVIEWDDAYGHGSVWLNPQDSVGAISQDGQWLEGYIFQEPIDSHQATGLWLEGVYIPLN